MGVSFTDHSGEIKAAFENAKASALMAIGLKAEGYAKGAVPVDTGRLKNSITFETDANSVTIGANEEYAKYVELGTRKRAAKPFLKPAATEHPNTYKAIVQKAFGG